MDETTFAKAFISLLKTTGGKVLQDDYVVMDLPNKPLVALPEMPQPKRKIARTAGDSSTITVNLKSIKPPKFNLSKVVSASDTVYALKKELLSDSSTGLTDAHSVDDIRLLIKGKVITNSKVLNDLVTDGSINFTVMVAAPKPKEDAEPEPELPSATVSEKSWAEIGEILTRDLGPVEGQNALQKFKASLSQ